MVGVCDEEVVVAAVAEGLAVAALAPGHHHLYLP